MPNYHIDKNTVPYENLPLSGTRRSIFSPCFFLLYVSIRPTPHNKDTAAWPFFRNNLNDSLR